MSKRVFDQAEVNRVAAIIKDNALAGSVSESVFTTGEEEPIYPKTIPEGEWTMETETKIDNHRAVFVAAGVQVIGEKTLAALAADPTVTKGSGTFSLGSGGSMAVDILPSKENKNPFAKDGEPNTVTKYGVVALDVETTSGRSGPALKSVKNALSEAFAGALKKA